jgi:two-component system chemotaxis response regulator CheB
MEALAAGAVAIIAKPKVGLKQFLKDASEDVVGAVKAPAARVRRPMCKVLRASAKLTADVILSAADKHSCHDPDHRAVVAIGTSTGGTQALEVVLTACRARRPAS